MNAQELAEAARDLLAGRVENVGSVAPLPAALTDLDPRTIRYYTTRGLLSKPQRVGRENRYDLEHLLSLLALRLRQADGLTLAQIQADDTPPRDVVARRGFLLEALSQWFTRDPTPAGQPQTARLQTTPAPPHSTAIPEPDEDRMKTKTESLSQKPSSPAWTRAPLDTSEAADPSATTTAGEAGVQVLPHAPEFEEWRSALHLGNAFLFVQGLEKQPTLANRLHRLLSGLRAGPGQVDRAVLPIPPDGLELPGARVTQTPPARGQLGFVLPDKDVYRPGDDVARLFVYLPFACGETARASLLLAGSIVEEAEIELDDNGCGLLRHAVVASGPWEVRIEPGDVSCTFDAAAYELAPLTVTLSRIERDADTLRLQLAAESYGSPLEGQTDTVLLEDGHEVGRRQVAFDKGAAELEWNVDDLDGTLSLRFTDSQDPRLVAGVPIPGARRAEREETTLCELGRLTSVSLLPSAGTFEERGLHVLEGAVTNSIVALERCVDREIVLQFRERLDLAHVLLRDPRDGREWLHELGDVPAGRRVTLPLEAPFVTFHVAGFTSGRPWEGSGIFLRRSETHIQLHAPEQLEPGKLLSIDLTATTPTSVYLKIADQRMRTGDEAIHAAARFLKDWAGSHRANASTGIVERQPTAPALPPSVAAYFDNLGAVEGAAVFAGVAHQLPKKSRGRRRDQLEDALGDDTRTFDVKQDLARSMVAPAGAEAREELEEDCFAIDECCDKETAYGGSEEPEARAAETDLIYCDLVRVDGQRTLEIRLPEVIGVYDIRAFAVCDGDWSQTVRDIRVEKEAWIEALVPQIAHADDSIECSAIAVRPPENSIWSVQVDGHPVEFERRSKAGRETINWLATSGVHEVSLRDAHGRVVDKVRRIVEAPGEEIVLGQELRILRAGESFDVDEEEALSVAVLPGMESELTVAVDLVVNFGHACCEQTAAIIAGACVAATVGDDSSREKAHSLIVKGACRMESMWRQGEGFATYPEQSQVIEQWSSTAARRLASFGMLLDDTTVSFPGETRNSIEKLVTMGRDVLSAHGDTARAEAGDMERAYYGEDGASLASAERRAPELVAQLNSVDLGPYSDKTEAAFCAAVLLRGQRVAPGIDVANAVAKAMGGTMGGGHHGSYEALAYLLMVDEMRRAGVVPGVDGRVRVDGREQTVADAVSIPSPAKIEALDGAVAIRIQRLERLQLDAFASEVPVKIELVGDNGSRGVLQKIIGKANPVRAGKPARLRIGLEKGYQSGDLVSVQLPASISRMINGAKTKRFQVDFCGEDSVEIELVAHGPTCDTERWAVAVRNMYDTSRIGSPGVQEVRVVAS